MDCPLIMDDRAEAKFLLNRELSRESRQDFLAGVPSPASISLGAVRLVPSVHVLNRENIDGALVVLVMAESLFLLLPLSVGCGLEIAAEALKMLS